MQKMNWENGGDQQLYLNNCWYVVPGNLLYLNKWGNTFNPKSQWLNTVKIYLYHVESSRVGQPSSMLKCGHRGYLVGEDGARSLLKSQAWKWFISLFPPVAEQNSVIAPGELARKPGECSLPVCPGKGNCYTGSCSHSLATTWKAIVTVQIIGSGRFGLEMNVLEIDTKIQRAK